MLAALSIRDIVLIDRLDLAFRPGLTVLTGETGAGKSILLDALGLALGARADARLVRPGAEAAHVAATFELPDGHAAWAALARHGIAAPDEGEPLILRRALGADGKSRAYVNDQPVGAAALRDVADALVEIEGTRGDAGLMNAELHRAALDSFGGLAAHAAAVREAHRAWRDAGEALDRARAAQAKDRAEEAFLRHVAGELDALDPQPGEEEALAQRRATLMNAGKLTDAIAAALSSLGEGGGLEAGLAAARRALDRVANVAGPLLAPALAALDRAQAEAAEAAALIEKAASDLDSDPRRLEEAEERLFALRAAARKHATTVDTLPALKAEFARRLAALTEGDAGIDRLAKEEAASRAKYLQAARALAEGRAEAASRLDRAVAAELPALRLDKARFATVLEPLAETAWSEHGTERVRFAVATNPGAAPGPIGRIASRGEMSRFLLALRVVLAEAGALPTLVLDEVDAGIGGATAAAVGERLAKLGRAMQLLVVTHSPQVAAHAAAHWRVTKATTKGAALTRAEELAGEARREEIARMLAGARITDAARAAADSLMTARAR
jgi:DNA repair protein RecN (Recombination protein N)